MTKYDLEQLAKHAKLSENRYLLLSEKKDDETLDNFRYHRIHDTYIMLDLPSLYVNGSCKFLFNIERFDDLFRFTSPFVKSISLVVEPCEYTSHAQSGDCTQRTALCEQPCAFSQSIMVVKKTTDALAMLSHHCNILYPC